MSVLLAFALAATSLAVPGRTNTNASIATAGQTVAVVWAAAAPSGSTDIYSAISADGARTFAAPVRVNDVAGDARVSGEQPPRVAIAPALAGRAGSIVVVWTTKGANGTKLVQARSSDGGRTFSHAAIVPGADAAGNRGWEAVTVAGSAVDAVWLDHRDMAAAGHEGHMSPQQSQLFFSALDSSVPPHAITAGVCYCCKTALAAADGSVYAAWRHVYPGNLRDIAFTVSRDGGKTFAPPIRVSEDHWMLDGCPDDGPAMVVDARKRVHIVWPTLVQSAEAGGEPTIALFHAMSVDGRHFTERERVPTDGLPHHPQIALRADGSLEIAWDEVKDGIRRGAVARVAVGEDGRASFKRDALPGGGPALYPVLAATPDATIAAWTSGSASASTIAVLRLP